MQHVNLEVPERWASGLGPITRFVRRQVELLKPGEEIDLVVGNAPGPVDPDEIRVTAPDLDSSSDWQCRIAIGFLNKALLDPDSDPWGASANTKTMQDILEEIRKALDNIRSGQ